VSERANPRFPYIKMHLRALEKWIQVIPDRFAESRRCWGRKTRPKCSRSKEGERGRGLRSKSAQLRERARV
jgi:hypothetical protein